MELFNMFMQEYGIQIIGTLLLGLAGVLGVLFKNLATRYLNDKTKQSVAKIVVQGIEQAYKDLHGEDKLNKGLELLSQLLAEKGIKVSDLEMRVLLEAAVGEFNKAFERSSSEAASE